MFERRDFFLCVACRWFAFCLCSLSLYHHRAVGEAFEKAFFLSLFLVFCLLRKESQRGLIVSFVTFKLYIQPVVYSITRKLSFHYQATAWSLSSSAKAFLMDRLNWQTYLWKSLQVMIVYSREKETAIQCSEKFAFYIFARFFYRAAKLKEFKSNTTITHLHLQMTLRWNIFPRQPANLSLLLLFNSFRLISDGYVSFH